MENMISCKENLQGMTMEVALEDNNLMEKVLPPDEQEIDVELEAKEKKYLRGEGANLETLKDKKLKTQLASREKLYGKSAKAAAKIEKWLLPASAGYLETDGLEKTWRVKQTDIAKEVDILSSRNQYDIVLPDFGPYKLDFTASGRHMLAGGRKGHLALVDMMSMNLIKEIQVRETVRDVTFLHNDQFFAAAQKKYSYIYARDGTELHCLKERGPVARLRFLKNHFLLASVNKIGQLHYQDVTYGDMVASIRTGKGRTDVMEVNPYNGVVALGHSGGTVTMWKPTSQAPLVQMQCHPGPVSSVAFHPNGHLMATSGKERKLKIWDLRKFEEVQTIHGFHAKTLSFSQKGLLAAGTGSFVQVLGDSSGDYSRYMSHSMVKGYQIEKVMFRPYEDVLGIGHSMGWSSVLIPGSGEPNFDSWVANPFETTKQRREKEVHLLLDKLPPETIMLDPSKIGAMRPSRRKERPTRGEIEAEKEVAVEAAKGVELKKKTKGRNKPSKRTKKKKELVENVKKTFPEQEQGAAGKKRRIGEDAAADLPSSLKRRKLMTMEDEFDSKLSLQGNASNVEGSISRSKSFAFKAPQENFTVQDFELDKIYGVGSYSKVVRATKKKDGGVYALKIMDKKFITKENKTAYVKLERIVLDQLDHPGIVKLFFTFQDNFSLYMALESCEGGELFDQITRKGCLSEDEARFYGAEVVDALEYIHTMGLIHRDIKPENLLLTSDGHIKIADFGSVKPMQDSQITLLPNAASDDKACTFVGTAAYVPPEVLNSSPATFGNDLWALGCTLYQMLSGTSPFKDASEWLIFQRIIARDLKFPNHFSEAARDLIDRLLDTDPSRRPGAGPEGYASLKRHPFFKGVDWKKPRSQTPPKLAPDPSSQSASPERDGSPWNPTHVGDASAMQNNGPSSTSESSGSITRLASIDSFDSRWQQFLEPGESVIMLSAVKKLRKITSKKVQLILTNKPRLIYVDPSKLVAKGNIIWSDNSSDLNVQISSPSHFKICTPKKVLSIEDSKQRALQWRKAIETLQNR
uniref:non-specific serine/threonine protein kinase n=2 Tax=Brassica oleracea var. oleracea TaxID=109376 RepID=A0A0D3CLE6_BRAOL